MSNLPDVVTKGDRRESLEAIRDLLAEKMPASRGASAALVAKTLADLVREIDELPDGREVSQVDDLAARRADRRANAAS